MILRIALGSAILAVSVLGCGSASQPVTPADLTPAHSSTATAHVDAQSMPTPAGSLRRSDVRAVLSQGLAMFLQRVEFDVEHPVFREHHFVGFRISALHGNEWSSVDLRPGDVITSVNGSSIEHPEQAQQAFLSLAIASELRVDYERDDQPRTIRLEILDDQ